MRIGWENSDSGSAVKSKARREAAGLRLRGSPRLGGHGSLGSSLSGHRLRNLAHQEGLKIRFTSGPLYAADRVSGLASNEIALSSRAGYFKLALLALQSFGNVIGGDAIVQPHGTLLAVSKTTLLVEVVPPREGMLLF